MINIRFIQPISKRKRPGRRKSGGKPSPRNVRTLRTEAPNVRTERFASGTRHDGAARKAFRTGRPQTGRIRPDKTSHRNKAIPNFAGPQTAAKYLCEKFAYFVSYLARKNEIPSRKSSPRSAAANFLRTDATVMRVSTDSRTLSEPDGALFVAIRSARRDGNRYIAELYRRGVRAFLTDSPVDAKAYPLAGFVRCDDSVAALQRLAACFRRPHPRQGGGHHRQQRQDRRAKNGSPSSARRGVKLFRSPKSYNSQIGVPLSLLMTAGGRADRR